MGGDRTRTGPWRSPVLAEMGRVVIGLALVWALIHMLSRATPFFDFDLHYFAGVIEQHGSYTDTTTLFRVMAEAGVAKHDEGVYGTPTLVALVFQPLSLLGLLAAHAVWVVVAGIALVASVRAAAGRRWLIWLVALLFTPALISSVYIGNPSTFTFCLIAAAYGNLRKGDQRAAGIALGVATALKLFPGFLVVALIANRQWRAVKWAAAVFAALVVVTVPALGFHDAVRAFRMMASIGGYVHPWEHNESMPALLLHMGVGQVVASWSSKVLLVAGAVAVLRWRHPRPHVTLGVAVLVMLLAQSISWRHYFPLALLVLLAVQDCRPTRSAWFGALLAATFSVGIFEYFFISGLPAPTGEVAGSMALLVIAAFAVRRDKVALLGSATEGGA
jgi:hypothetical protein